MIARAVRHAATGVGRADGGKSNRVRSNLSRGCPPAAPFEIFLVLQPRLAEMYLGIYDPRQDVEILDRNRLGRRCAL